VAKQPDLAELQQCDAEIWHNGLPVTSCWHLDSWMWCRWPTH